MWVEWRMWREQGRNVLGVGLCAGFQDISACHARRNHDDGPVVRICEVARVDRGRSTLGAI